MKKYFVQLVLRDLFSKNLEKCAEETRRYISWEEDRVAVHTFYPLIGYFDHTQSILRSCLSEDK